MVKLYTKQKIFILITSLLVAIISLFPFVNAHAAEKSLTKLQTNNCGQFLKGDGPT